jgi:hypothetical protein
MLRKPLIILAAILASAALRAATPTDTPSATLTATLTATPTVTQTVTTSPSATRSDTPTVTRSATQTITRTPAPVSPSPSPTTTPTLIDLLYNDKFVDQSTVPNFGAVNYTFYWHLNVGPVSAPGYVEIVDTLPTGFVFSAFKTFTPYPTPTAAPGTPTMTPAPTPATLCAMTITAGVMTLRWCAPYLNESEGIVMAGYASGTAGTIVSNQSSGFAGPGWAPAVTTPVLFQIYTATVTMTPTRTQTPDYTPTSTGTAGPASINGTPVLTCLVRQPLGMTNNAGSGYEHAQFLWLNNKAYLVAADASGLRILVESGNKWVDVPGSPVAGASTWTWHPAAVGLGAIWVSALSTSCSGCDPSGSTVIYAFDGSSISLKGNFGTGWLGVIPVLHQGQMWALKQPGFPNIYFYAFNGSSWDLQYTYFAGQPGTSVTGSTAYSVGGKLFLTYLNIATGYLELWAFDSGAMTQIYTPVNAGGMTVSLGSDGGLLYAYFSDGSNSQALFSVDPATYAKTDRLYDLLGPVNGDGQLYADNNGVYTVLTRNTGAPGTAVTEVRKLSGSNWVTVGCPENNQNAADALLVENGLIYREGDDYGSVTRRWTAVCPMSPSACSSPTPIPAADTLIDDFEDGDRDCSHNGTWGGNCDTGGSSVLILPAPGCHAGTPNYSLRAQGSCSGVAGGQYAGLSLSYGGGIDLSGVTGTNRLLGFEAYSTSPLTITVRVDGAGGNSCQVDIYLDGGGWQNVTIALPTHEDPGDLPQLSGSPWSLVSGSCTGIDFLCTRSTAGTTSFDFQIDDVQWGGYPTNNRTRVLSWCGCTQSDLDEAYSYGLGESAVWILLVIRQHCGCHPHDIMALRATMSWGQICANYGTTWSTVVDDMWTQCQGAGMDPDDPTLDQIYPALRNAVPTPQPNYPVPTPYVPRGPLGLSLPGDC